MNKTQKQNNNQSDVQGHIVRRGTHAEYTSPVVNYTFELTREELSERAMMMQGMNPDRHYVTIEGFTILANGFDNLQPNRIHDLINSNGMVAGLMQSGVELTVGAGPGIYEKVETATGLEKKWVTDPAIESFLNDIDYEKYLLEAAGEYAGCERVFSQIFRNKGVRIGREGKVADLKIIADKDCRLEYPEKYLQYPKNIIVGNYSQPWMDGLISYPVWNPKNPFQNPISMYERSMPRYGSNYNFKPTYMSAEIWHKLDGNTPVVLDFYLNNSMLPDFHIQSPIHYWETLRKKLVDECETSGKTWDEKIYLDAEAEVFNRIAGTLSGIKNKGKFAHTKYDFDGLGNLRDWKFTPLNKNIEHFVKGVLDIHKSAQFVSTNVFRIPTALSNISTEGNLSSGSEILYSLALYNATKTAIPEMIICDALNKAIAANFKTNRRVGFYRPTVKNESAVRPKDRMTQNA